MIVLKNSGEFEILTPLSELKAQLLRVEQAGRTCYRSERVPITGQTAAAFFERLLRRGHESVIEHTCLTVKFTGVSRGFTHEMVRHRLAAYSQESTRYVDYAPSGKGPDVERFQVRCVVPPHRDENEKIPLRDGRQMSLVDMLTEIEEFYRALRRVGWVPQDARQVLPIGVGAEIVVTANWREWRHIFRMRTTKPAHWEMRLVMVALLRELKTHIPVVFADFQEAGVDVNGVPYFVVT